MNSGILLSVVSYVAYLDLKAIIKSAVKITFFHALEAVFFDPRELIIVVIFLFFVDRVDGVGLSILGFLINLALQWLELQE